jgi:NADPH-dependent ferric siderophore reductase
MEKRAKKITRLTVSLNLEDHAVLAALAAKSDVSLSWVVRQAIHRFIQQHQAQAELPLALPDEPPSPFRKNYR